MLCGNTLLAKDIMLPMSSHLSNTLHLMGFVAVTKEPEVIEHGQLGWVEVEASPPTVTHRPCRL